MLSSLQSWLVNRSARRLMLLGALAASAPATAGCTSTPEPEEPVVVVSTEPPPKQADNSGKRTKGEEEKAVKRELTKQERDRQIAQNAGILGALKDSGEMSSVFGSDDALGKDPLSARGSMWGEAIGESFGAGGLGLVGTGRGGGGTGHGTIGLGSVGTIGRGGTGTGSGFGRGSGRLGRSSASRPRVRGGKGAVKGALPKDVVRRVIRRHIAAIRYCYEKTLNQNPGVQGKVVVQFTIARNGMVAVAKVDSSTVGDKKLEKCLLSRFKRMKFPKPSGVVLVRYPLVFSVGNPAKPKPPVPAQKSPAPPARKQPAPSKPPASPAAPKKPAP